MVSISRLSLEREVSGVLVRGVVPQSELDCSAVHSRVKAVGTGEALEPGDTTEKLTLNGGRTLRVTVGLVEENGTTRTASVGHL